MPDENWIGSFIKPFAEKITNQGMLTLIVLVALGVGAIVSGFGDEVGWQAVAVTLGILCLTGLVVVFLSYHYRHKRLTLNLEQVSTDLAVAPRVISPKEYFDTLQEWNASGPGCVLLYNIELQSFRNRDLLERTWGKVAEMTNIKKVVLALPEEKVRNWEQVVLREAGEGRFFSDPSRHKFEVCESRELTEAGVTAHEARIAFAVYRQGEDPATGALHPKTVLFILSQPFSTFRESEIEDAPCWWDYHHILVFVNDEQIIDSLEHLWHDSYTPELTRDVSRVLRDIEPLKQWDPQEFFQAIHMTPARQEELLPHLGPRHVQRCEPRVLPVDTPEGQFQIEYATDPKDTDTAVNGRYSGLDCGDRQARMAVIWVGGFTEYQGNRLAELFEAHLRKADVAQFSYAVSPEPQFVTLSRYEEDMREVLEYVNAQHHVVVRDKLVLIARSINGLVAALVASQEPYLDMVAGIILVSPVFDVVDMMDNYRSTHGARGVRVEKLWRLIPGYCDADQWERPDPERPGRGWLHFFGQNVSLALAADIFRQEEAHRYRLESLIKSIGILTQRQRYVYVLSNPDDPITGSAEALRKLDAACGGALDPEYYRYIEVQSSHEMEVQASAYPFKIRDEVQKTQEALRDALSSVGLPTLVASAAD